MRFTIHVNYTSNLILAGGQMPLFLNLTSLFFLVALSACSGSASSSASGSLTLRVSSSALVRQSAPARASCNVSVDGASTAGNCFTPTGVSVYFSGASLASTSGGASSRILGGGDKYHGFDDIFRKEFLDLKAVPNVDGDDNLQDATASSFNIITFTVSAIETVYQATAAGKYYHVRTFFVDQPPSTSTAFSTCGLSAGTLAEMDAKGLIYTGLTPKKGDLMVCVKSGATDTCAASDFSWVDGSGALQSSSRPASAKQLTGTHLMSTESCSSASPERPEINWGSMGLSFGLSTPVTVSAAIAEGVKTYTTTSGGTTRTGTKLTVNVDVDLAGALFVHSTPAITDLATATEADILANLDKIVLKPIYVENNKSTASSADSNATPATVTLAVE